MYRRIRKDNSGISLVEVLVSMLILAIVIIPLLSSFVLSSRVNLKSRTKQYATILGQNVMEGIKNIDLERIALQFNNVASGGAFSIVPLTSLVDQTYGNGFCETDDSYNFISYANPADQSKLSIGQKVTGEYYFKGNSADTFYYLMQGVQEGTKRFDVRIQISSKNYKVGVATGAGIKQNNYEIPDVNILTGDDTAIINPASTGILYHKIGSDYEWIEDDDYYTINSIQTFDITALDYFKNEHQNYRNDVYLETGVTPPQVSDEDLQSKISRKTIITIEDLEVAGNNQFLVTAKVEYKFRDGEGVLYKSGEPAPSNTTKTFGGFYEQIAFDALSQIYLFHTPLVLGKWDNSSNLADVIYIDNQSSHLSAGLKVFIAQQRIYGIADGGFTNIETIRVNGNNTNNFKFYYNNAKSGKPLESADPFFTLNSANSIDALVTDGAARDRIYDATVQVYEQGSNELLHELSSTFTR